MNHDIEAFEKYIFDGYIFLHAREAGKTAFDLRKRNPDQKIPSYLLRGSVLPHSLQSFVFSSAGISAAAPRSARW